jgi:ribonuclease HI
MKSLKLNHADAQAVMAGKKTTTWRLYDEKNISVNDELELIDKVDAKSQQAWCVIGIAKVNTIVSKRLGELTDEDQQGEYEYKNNQEMFAAFKAFYGPDVGPATPVKIIKFTFMPYQEPKKLDAKIPTPTKVKLYADGGSRGNPGASAAGFVVMDGQDRIIIEEGVYLGITTNNQAEYSALKLGLEAVLKLGVKNVDVYMDSLLVINQMKGTFKVKNKDIMPIRETILALANQFETITYTQVPRELNKLADAEVNQTLDAQ